jgi:hypothetical protein
MTLSGGIVLEVAVDLSSDRLLMLMMMMMIKESTQAVIVLGKSIITLCKTTI